MVLVIATDFRVLTDTAPLKRIYLQPIRDTPEKFPCLNRHGPIEAARRPSSPRPDWPDFRVLTDTAPLKLRALRRLIATRCAFPCLNRHGPIEAAPNAGWAFPRPDFRVLTDTAPLKLAFCWCGFCRTRHFRVLTDTAPLKLACPNAGGTARIFPCLNRHGPIEAHRQPADR